MNKTLEWLYRAENSQGGINAWQSPNGSWHSQYPEVTGYLIPTLIKHGALDLVTRCADWLLKIQNESGSFNGLDGLSRPFDTAAVIEGLEAIYKATGTAIYRDAANRAAAWCRSQIMEVSGALRNNPASLAANIYQLRASYIIGNREEAEYWKQIGLFYGDREFRTHYLAYALEGMLNFGELDFAMPYLELAYDRDYLLQPFCVNRDWRATVADDDYCASAQMAILFHRVGFDVTKHYEVISRCIKDDGGLAQSTNDDRSIAWAAKFYLDLVYEMESVNA